MITIIFGAPGAGKTALNTYFLQKLYEEEGKELLELTRKSIIEENAKRKVPLTLPEKAPIFSNYKVNLRTGYKRYYQPYFINGFHIGLENPKKHPIMYLPKGSKVFLNEAQKYYDSRKKVPDWVSRFYEEHRHNIYDFYIDVQREKLIDLNIRALCKRFIELQSVEPVKNWTGDIERTIFHCREFDNYGDVEQYLNGSGKGYRTATHTYEGNIFELYDSYGCADEFTPPEGADYSYMPFLTKAEIQELPKDKSIYYSTFEPDTYRGESE